MEPTEHTEIDYQDPEGQAQVKRGLYVLDMLAPAFFKDEAYGAMVLVVATELGISTSVKVNENFPEFDALSEALTVAAAQIQELKEKAIKDGRISEKPH